MSSYKENESKRDVRKPSDNISESFLDEYIRTNLRFIKFILGNPANLAILFITGLIFQLIQLAWPFRHAILKNITGLDYFFLFSFTFLIIFIIIGNYLNSNLNKKIGIKEIAAQEFGLEDVYQANNSLIREHQKELDTKLSYILQFINEKEQNFSLTKEQQEEVSSKIVNSISNNLTKDFYDSVKDTIRTHISEDREEQLSMLVKRGDISVARLRREIEQLSRRANLNLTIGSTVTIGALSALSYFIIHEDFNSTDIQRVMMHFIPRLSLVLFIEFFSFFFLKLYRNSLHEIKYYQNELTNIEIKSIAIIFAVNYGKEEDISLIIKEAASTERNFKLQKDESTVELERNKAETHDLKEILKAALGAVAKKEK